MLLFWLSNHNCFCKTVLQFVSAMRYSQDAMSSGIFRVAAEKPTVAHVQDGANADQGAQPARQTRRQKAAAEPKVCKGH